MRDLLGVGFARFQIIEIHPLRFPSDPPELSPDFVLLASYFYSLGAQRVSENVICRKPGFRERPERAAPAPLW